jgi:hypothetical protein
MRSIQLLLGGLMLAIPACAKVPCAAPPPPREDFTLKGEVIEALEGGPLVLRVTLAFQGEKPVEMCDSHPESVGWCAFSTPEGWDRIEP